MPGHLPANALDLLAEKDKFPVLDGAWGNDKQCFYLVLFLRFLLGYNTHKIKCTDLKYTA